MAAWHSVLSLYPPPPLSSSFGHNLAQLPKVDERERKERPPPPPLTISVCSPPLLPCNAASVPLCPPRGNVLQVHRRRAGLVILQATHSLARIWISSPFHNYYYIQPLSFWAITIIDVKKRKIKLSSGCERLNPRKERLQALPSLLDKS